MPAADAELEQIKGELHTLAAPEQFYGANYLRLRHAASGTTLRCGPACAFGYRDCQGMAGVGV